MGRQTVQIAEICPADIIAEAGIPDDDMAVLDEHPREQERLDHAIANAVTSLLPDALVVSMREHTDRETGHVTRYWKVLQALDPATKRIGGPLARGLVGLRPGPGRQDRQRRRPGAGGRAPGAHGR
jgi:hypothetical protein